MRERARARARRIEGPLHRCALAGVDELKIKAVEEKKKKKARAHSAYYISALLRTTYVTVHPQKLRLGETIKVSRAAHARVPGATQGAFGQPRLLS